LPDLKVIDQAPEDHSRIFFAAWVTLETDDGDEVTYRIVGPDEIDADKGFISVDSPLARALLGKTIDDEVSIRVTDSVKHYFVLAIDYAETA
jgi:transcription elongation factor GreB